MALGVRRVWFHTKGARDDLTPPRPLPPVLGALLCGDDAEAAVEAAAISVDYSCHYVESTQSYHNDRLRARNVWCIKVDTSLVAEAAELFERADLRSCHARLDVTKKSSREEVRCRSGERFFAHHAGWHSDVAWISADDQPTHDTFHSLFERMGLAGKFGPIVGDAGGGVHLYSAFFVVRTTCSKTDMHVDYENEVETRALTLMTPLYTEYSEVEDFQLVYLDDEAKLRRYRYELGEAIVFGAGFTHSTEPGTATAFESRQAEAAEAEVAMEETSVVAGTDSDRWLRLPSRTRRRAHAYLCFTFGSDLDEHWAWISRTVDGQQSRQISRPAQPNRGQSLSLSTLGLRIEAGTADEHLNTPYASMRASTGADEPQQRTGQSRSQRRYPRGMLK